MVPIALCEQRRIRRACASAEIASPLTAHIHNEGACRGCEFKICKALEMIGTSRNSLYLPHVCRGMYPDFVTCKDQPAHRTVLSAPLFLEQNIKHLCRASSGPKLSAKLVCHSLLGGGGGGGGAPRSHPGSGTAIVSAADKGTG